MSLAPRGPCPAGPDRSPAVGRSGASGVEWGGKGGKGGYRAPDDVTCDVTSRPSRDGDVIWGRVLVSRISCSAILWGMEDSCGMCIVHVLPMVIDATTDSLCYLQQY